MQQHMQPANWTSLQKASGLLIAPTEQFQSCKRQPCYCSAFSLPGAMSQYCTTAQKHTQTKKSVEREKERENLHGKPYHDQV